MNRRNLLKLISLGVIGHELDIDLLLWVPGQKTIFIPSDKLTLEEIVRIELERILPKMKNLFDRDATFYRAFPVRESRKKNVIN